MLTHRMEEPTKVDDAIAIEVKRLASAAARARPPVKRLRPRRAAVDMTFLPRLPVPRKLWICGFTIGFHRLARTC